MSLVKDLLLIVFFGLSLAVAACGSSSSDDGDGDGGDFTVTSSEADEGFEPGGTVPDRFACEDVGGDNTIPKITWSGPPDGTLSYALVMLDLSTDPETVHGVACDMETTVTDTTDIPDDLACGALNYLGALGYAGPCPPAGETHTYQVTIYALDTAELGANSTDADTVIDAIENAALDSDLIRGTFTAD